MKRQLLSPCLLEEKRERKAKHVPKKAQTKHVKISKLLAALFYILNF